MGGSSAASEGDKGQVWEREGENMGGGGRVRMVGGEGESMGKRVSFEGRRRKP